MLPDFSNQKNYFTLIVIWLIGLLVGTKLAADFLPFDLSIMTAITLAAIILDNLINNRPIKIKTRPVYVVWYAFILLIIASYWWTRAPNYGFKKLFNLFPLVLVPVLWGKQWIKEYATFRTVFSIIFIATIFVFYYSGGLADLRRTLASTYFRLRIGEASNPIVVASFLGYGIIFMLSLLAQKNEFKQLNFVQNIQKIALLGFVIICIVLIFLTGSKGPIVALIGAFLLYYFFKNISIQKVLSTLIFAAVLGILLSIINVEQIILNLFPKDLHYFLGNRFINTASSNSVSARMDLIYFTFESISNKNILTMLFGGGIGDFGFASLNGIDDRYYPHNIFLEILYEIGLVGFCLFVYLMYYVIRINFTFKGESTEFKWLFICFYFFLIKALTTGDLPSNFGLFVHFILLLKFEDLYILNQRINAKNTHFFTSDYSKKTIPTCLS